MFQILISLSKAPLMIRVSSKCRQLTAAWWPWKVSLHNPWGRVQIYKYANTINKHNITINAGALYTFICTFTVMYISFCNMKSSHLPIHHSTFSHPLLKPSFKHSLSYIKVKSFAVKLSHIVHVLVLQFNVWRHSLGVTIYHSNPSNFSRASWVYNINPCRVSWVPVHQRINKSLSPAFFPAFFTIEKNRNTFIIIFLFHFIFFTATVGSIQRL